MTPANPDPEEYQLIAGLRRCRQEDTEGADLPNTNDAIVAFFRRDLEQNPNDAFAQKMVARYSTVPS